MGAANDVVAAEARPGEDGHFSYDVREDGRGISIQRRGEPTGVRRLARAPGLRAVLRWRPVARALAVAPLARLVDTPARFAARELARRRDLRDYGLRGSDVRFAVRHNSEDLFTLSEMWHLRVYEPPEPVAAVLRAVGRPPRIVDLGANIGLFGAQALARYPGSSLVAYEPDAASARIHRRCIELNDAAGRWRLVEACAAPADGTVEFAFGQGTGSHVAAPGAGRPTVEVPARDVFPDLARADLAKIDVEGAEWELLADPRFGAPPVVVVEYHAFLCPEPDSHAAAERRLRHAGYEVAWVYRGADGQGMLWGFRPAPAA
jgi:FkbM family methyltransferase